MAPPSIEQLQTMLWDHAPTKMRRAPYVLADMHACISAAYHTLPPLGVGVVNASHKTPFFEFLSDAVVHGLNLMSLHKQQLGEFPNEPMTFDDIPELVDIVPYLHRMLSAAYINIDRGNLDDLFWLEIANFCYVVTKVATRHSRDVRKIIVSRHFSRAVS